MMTTMAIIFILSITISSMVMISWDYIIRRQSICGVTMTSHSKVGLTLVTTEMTAQTTGDNGLDEGEKRSPVRRGKVEFNSGIAHFITGKYCIIIVLAASDQHVLRTVLKGKNKVGMLVRC